MSSSSSAKVPTMQKNTAPSLPCGVCMYIYKTHTQIIYLEKQLNELGCALFQKQISTVQNKYNETNTNTC